jgi:hypothetical protein
LTNSAVLVHTDILLAFNLVPEALFAGETSGWEVGDELTAMQSIFLPFIQRIMTGIPSVAFGRPGLEVILTVAQGRSGGDIALVR